MALKKAAERLLRAGTRDQKIAVYSDNQAVLMAMNNQRTLSKLVYETKVKWNHVERTIRSACIG